MAKYNPLEPSVSILCKLGSIAVHIEEFMGKKGHPFDSEAMKTLLNDIEVKAWLSAMDRLALIPKRRSNDSP